MAGIATEMQVFKEGIIRLRFKEGFATKLFLYLRNVLYDVKHWFLDPLIGGPCSTTNYTKV